MQYWREWCTEELKVSSRIKAIFVGSIGPIGSFFMKQQLTSSKNGHFWQFKHLYSNSLPDFIPKLQIEEPIKHTYGSRYLLRQENIGNEWKSALSKGVSVFKGLTYHCINPLTRADTLRHYQCVPHMVVGSVWMLMTRHQSYRFSKWLHGLCKSVLWTQIISTQWPTCQRAAYQKMESSMRLLVKSFYKQWLTI